MQGASDAKNALDAAMNGTNGTTKPARKAYKRKAPVTSQSAEAQGDDATLRATKKRLLETKLREEYDKAGFGGSIPFQSWRRGLSADVCQKFQEDVDKMMIDSGMDGVITEAAA